MAENYVESSTKKKKTIIINKLTYVIFLLYIQIIDCFWNGGIFSHKYAWLLCTLILFPCIYTEWEYAIFFHIAYFDFTYFRAFFTCVAMCGNILHPAILPKIKICTVAIIINFIVKHHVLRIYQCIILHEDIKHYQNACFPNDSRYKVIKNLSTKYAYRQWNFQALKNGHHPFCKHISSNGDVINGDVFKT